MSEPQYLVQTPDGILHAYWDLSILRINLAENRDVPVKLFRLAREMGARRYHPTTLDELMEMAA